MDALIWKVKLALLAFLPAVLVTYLGVLAVPLLLLVAAGIIDYATGIVAAPLRGEVRSSRVGWRGIVRKVLTWCMVLVGMLVDGALFFLEMQMGWTTPFTEALPVACLVCMWLLFNELVSIVENMADLGVQVPFLLPLVKWVRRTVEQAVPELDDTDDADQNGGQTGSVCFTQDFDDGFAQEDAAEGGCEEDGEP